EMADWMKRPEMMAEFVSALGGTCVYKPRRVEMVAEMVPVDVRIADEGMWRLAEAESGISTGGIVGGRWIKPEQRRVAGQRVAHMKIEFATPEAANHAIDHGIFLQGKNIRVRKSEEEARRCARCQKYDGHLAHSCTSTMNVCGRCMADHRTGECTVNDAAAFRCGNCKATGHGAVSRDCPVFQAEQQCQRARDPTAGYRYFPTQDPRTW
ncbi:hypothetical protein DFH09DRAFT_810959, partial [Mycena vulgaris]